MRFSENDLWTIFLENLAVWNFVTFTLNFDQSNSYSEPSGVSIYLYVNYMLSPTNYFWYAYGFCTTLFVLSAMTSFVGTRADFVIVRAITYSGVMMCYGFRGLAIGPVTVYGVMMWYGIWYVLMIWCVCDMMCLETVRRFENFWSYDVLWHQRRGVTTFLNPIHDLICICTFASRTGLLCLRCWCVCSFWLQLCLWFLYLLLYILSTSPVLTPVSSGAVFHARRYRSSFGWSSSLGYSFCCVGELPLIRSLLLVHIFCCVCILYIWMSGYGGALSRHMFVCSVLFRGL